MSEMYDCAHCGGTFEKGWSDEESQTALITEQEAVSWPLAPEPARCFAVPRSHRAAEATRGLPPVYHTREARPGLQDGPLLYRDPCISR